MAVTHRQCNSISEILSQAISLCDSTIEKANSLDEENSALVELVVIRALVHSIQQKKVNSISAADAEKILDEVSSICEHLH